MSSVDPTQLTTLENQLMQLILDGDSDDARVLQGQQAAARVVRRSTPGGSGCFADFSVSEGAARLHPARDARITNLAGEIEVENGDAIGFWTILHITRGELSMLEVIAPSAPWPAHPRLKSWFYTERSATGIRVH